MNATSAPVSTTDARVLLVDDDIEELAALASELRQRGAQVALANGVSMACERAKTARVDVIVAAIELTEARDDGVGLGLLDALAIELGQLPPILLLVRSEGPGPLQGEAVVRGDVGTIMARVQALASRISRGPESAAPAAIYSGSLANVSLSDVLETLWVDRKTGTLGVTTPFGLGDVCLVDGSIVDVVYLRFEGTKALVRMIGEPEGRFLFTPETPPVLGRISTHTADLLIEVEAQLGEVKRLRGQLGDLTAKALLAADVSETDVATTPSQRRPVHAADLSPLARAVLTKLRAPATIEDVLDDFPESDAQVLSSLVELDTAGRLKRLPHETYRVPLVGTDQLHLMRALVSRAAAAGFAGATRLVFAGTPSRLAVFAHAALCLADSLAPTEPAPPIPIPHAMATVRFGDDVDLDLVALPLVPAYAPLWPLTLAGAAIVVRLDDAAGPALADACAAAELAVLDAHVLVGSLEEGSVAQVASLVRAAIEATQGG